MIRRPPNPHRTDHPFPYSPLSRSYQSNSRRGNSAQNVDSLYLPMLELVDGPGQGPRALTEEVQAQASLLDDRLDITAKSEEHTSELQSLMRISYAVFCLKKKKNKTRRIIKKTTRIKTQ